VVDLGHVCGVELEDSRLVCGSRAKVSVSSNL
jgi:hypothetical protein